jgi:hypothetical protein
MAACSCSLHFWIQNFSFLGWKATHRKKESPHEFPRKSCSPPKEHKYACSHSSLFTICCYLLQICNSTELLPYHSVRSNALPSLLPCLIHGYCWVCHCAWQIVGNILPLHELSCESILNHIEGIVHSLAYWGLISFDGQIAQSRIMVMFTSTGASSCGCPMPCHSLQALSGNDSLLGNAPVLSFC